MFEDEEKIINQEINLKKHSGNKIKSDIQKIEEIPNKDLFYLTWENVDLKINIKKGNCFKGKKKSMYVLKNISGYAKSGECLAIMGGSGAGKSTLLNIISGKLKKSSKMELKGKILLNGHPMDYNKYKNIIGFVLQTDIFLESMTVKEIFKFVIAIKDSKMSDSQQEQKINNLIKDLKLEKAQNNRVGGSFEKGISGGEKRRLNIGFELATDPKILFLDEPTSGLDSYTSFIIIKLLKKLARAKNILIIYTIHQPSIDIGDLFDRLLVLNKGKIMFFDEKKNLEKFLEETNEQSPEQTNPLDHIIDLSLIGGPEKDEKFFKKYETEDNGLKKIEKIIKKSEIDGQKLTVITKKASFCKQFSILSKRSLLNFVRNPMTFKIRIIQVLFISLIIILLYFRMAEPDKKFYSTIQERLGALFFLSINLFFLYFQTVLAVFPLERALFSKEYNSGLYDIIPYYFSKLIIEIPLTGIFPAVFIAIIYYAINFYNDISIFFLTIFIAVLASWFATLLGLFFGSLIKDSKMAIDIAPLVLVPFLIFSGFPSNSGNIFEALKVIEFISPIRYFFELFVTAQFNGLREELEDFWPLKTLKFDLGYGNLFLIISLYMLLLMFMALAALKMNSRAIDN